MTVAIILNAKGHDVVTAKAKDTVADICTLLEEKGIGAVVIVNSAGGVEGIISERDIVRAIATSGAGSLTQPASSIMTKDVVVCTPDETIRSLMGKMTEGKFRHIPVLDGGKLGGIVSIGDVVKRRIAEAESEAQAMREYITTG